MKEQISGFLEVKKKYLKFIKSQEVLSEPFRDKLKQLNNFYLPISQAIYKNYLKNKKTRIIGLAGGQGTGKSTISQLLKIVLKKQFNLETVVFSIDDFYKTLNDRKQMSKEINHLFLTRGVPGTHDLKLLYKCIKNLKKKNFKNFLIPKFDKSKDDRFEKKKRIII
jgi:D-glycerate 3-kinase